MKKIKIGIFIFLLCFITPSIILAANENNNQNNQFVDGNQNQGIANQIQNRLASGNYTLENGERIQIQEKIKNKFQIKVGDVSANTTLNMTQEQAQEKFKLKANLSNGRNAEIKIMPNTASETALERLRLKVCSEENGCQIELKEVGQGQEIKAAYEVQAQKQAKVLGLFKTKMEVKAQVNAENGELIRVDKPWWSFLASESEE